MNNGNTRDGLVRKSDYIGSNGGVIMYVFLKTVLLRIYINVPV